MKIKLPKDLKGVKFPQVLSIDMNNFDIDVFLPSLFFTILAQGKGKAKHTNDPKAIMQFIDKLSTHPDLEGFDDVEGRRVLERLVRTALITTSGVGRSHADEQITSIVPYSLLAHKPGFPVESSRHRGADTFIYQALNEQLGAYDNLRQLVKDVFGRGVIIGKAGELGGEYDGTTELDTLTRLSVAFLKGFEPVRPRLNRENDIVGACPGLSKALATDLSCYLRIYHASMPIQAFTHYLLTLINFELFTYTLKLVHAVNTLVHDPATLPPAMHDPVVPSPPPIYIDFTGLANGRSQEMARACVRRDIEAYQQFLSSNLLLRQLHKYVEDLKRLVRRKAVIEQTLQAGLTGPQYLQALLLLWQNPAIGSDIEAEARLDVDIIFRENIDPDDEDSSMAQNQLEAIIATVESDVDQVVNLLVEGQRDDAIRHFIQWYWSTGGLNKDEGILRGSRQSRKSWRYAPTNELLAVLVQVAAARLAPSQQGHEGRGGIQPIRLQEFLTFLDERFGIIVDHPPAP
ncbi:MAG TPA: hypothetical protein VH593_06985, partial [Ktedonobacteraceae bacterium]